jgi:predicted DNA-binding transcriptional regulator AlpA
MSKDLLDVEAACQLIGGCTPINAATLYRGAKAGIYPKPVRVAPNVSRWIRSELELAIERRIAERDQLSAAEDVAPLQTVPSPVKKLAGHARRRRASPRQKVHG